MAIDRQTIEKRDFPIARRGYDIVAVDEHLGSVAAEVERLADGAAAPAPTGGIAALAAEQVRVIVEAAEQSAAEIERQARGEAARITGDADTAARNAREAAGAEAAEHVTGVRQATDRMLQRVEALQAELGSLVEDLRTSARRVSADLQLLEGQVGEIRAGAPAGGLDDGADLLGDDVVPVADPPPLPAAAPPPAPAPAPAPVERRSAEELIAPTRVQPADEVEVPLAEPAPAVADPASALAPADPPPAAAPAQSSLVDDEDDVQAENARLIALNMALNGEPRDTALAYLRDNFTLGDPEGLLDEVYAEARGEAA